MRRCGPCTACCSAAATGAEKCNCPRHAAAAGLKPFQCSWLQGHLRSDERPDKCGMLFWEEPDAGFGAVVTALEAWPGAAECSLGKAAIGWMRTRLRKPVVERLATGQKVVVMPEPGALLSATDRLAHKIASDAERRADWQAQGRDA